jgi:hypothetical protein
LTYSSDRRDCDDKALARRAQERSLSALAETQNCTVNVRLVLFALQVLQRAAFGFGQAAPHAGILAGAECPVQAGGDDVTSPTHSFCGFDLLQGWACGSDGEEQFRVLMSTCACD